MIHRNNVWERTYTGQHARSIECVVITVLASSRAERWRRWRRWRTDNGSRVAQRCRGCLRTKHGSRSRTAYWRRRTNKRRSSIGTSEWHTTWHDRGWRLRQRMWLSHRHVSHTVFHAWITSVSRQNVGTQSNAQNSGQRTIHYSFCNYRQKHTYLP